MDFYEKVIDPLLTEYERMSAIPVADEDTAPGRAAVLCKLAKTIVEISSGFPSHFGGAQSTDDCARKPDRLSRCLAIVGLATAAVSCLITVLVICLNSR